MALPRFHDMTDLDDFIKPISYGNEDDKPNPMKVFVKAGQSYVRSKDVHSMEDEYSHHRKINEPEDAAFSYDPILSTTEMRVLQLYPGLYNDEIRCKLHHCLAEPQDMGVVDDVTTVRYKSRSFATSISTRKTLFYTAISYSWGDPTFSHSIRCGGKSLKITKALDIALRYFRDREQSVILWVDQICINQQDLEEKSQQVLLMPQIYRQAWNVVVWLGDEHDNSGIAMDTILAVNSALQFLPEGQIPDAADLQRLFLPAPGSEAWSSLQHFLDRPWFYRCWIIQEIVLSYTRYVMCGSRMLTWGDVGLFAIIAHEHGLSKYIQSPLDVNYTAKKGSGLVALRNLDAIANRYNVLEHHDTILSILDQTRDAEATLAKDKVYAVMALSDTIFIPDYSERTTATDLLMEVAMKVVPERTARLLCCLDNTSDEGHAGIPSWVPDWTQPRLSNSLGFSTSSRVIYNAACSKTSLLAVGTRVQGHHLTLRGACVDTITAVSSCLRNPQLSDIAETPTSTSSETLKFIRACLRMFDSTALHPTIPDANADSSDLFAPLWRTLTANKRAGGREIAPFTYGPIFSLLFITARSNNHPALSSEESAVILASNAQLKDGKEKRKKEKVGRPPLTLAHLASRKPKETYVEAQSAFADAVRGRRFCTTAGTGRQQKSRIALAPEGTRVGDKVCVIEGMHVLFVVRDADECVESEACVAELQEREMEDHVFPAERSNRETRQHKEQHYKFVGECYVDGLMNGELLSAAVRSESKIEMSWLTFT